MNAVSETLYAKLLRTFPHGIPADMELEDIQAKLAVDQRSAKIRAYNAERLHSTDKITGEEHKRLIAERRAQVAEMTKRGMMVKDVAEALNMPVGRVCHDRAVLRRKGLLPPRFSTQKKGAA